jgi:hypothetical protein
VAFAFHMREDIGDVVQASDQTGPEIEAFGTVGRLRRGLLLIERREPGAEGLVHHDFERTTPLPHGFPQRRRNIILEREGLRIL